MVDSGCTAHGFIDRAYAAFLPVTVKPTLKPHKLYLADGKVSDMITEYVLIPICTGQHQETALFFLTNLAKSTPLILGLPWLQRHNPYVDWTAMTLTFLSLTLLPNQLLALDSQVSTRQNNPQIEGTTTGHSAFSLSPSHTSLQGPLRGGRGGGSFLPSALPKRPDMCVQSVREYRARWKYTSGPPLATVLHR